MAGKSAWDLIQPIATGFIDSFKPENVPVSQGWKDAAREQNELRRNFQDYAPGATRQKPTSGSSSYAGPGGNPDGSGQGQAQQNPGIGPYQGHPTPAVPTRDVPKADGARGTQTSPGGGMPILTMADASAFYQSRGLGGFSSNQLPGTTQSQDVRGNLEAVPFGGQETSVTSNTMGAYMSDGQAYPALDPNKPGAAFNPEAPSIVDSEQRLSPTSNVQYARSGGTSRLDAALNDTAGMQSYMSKFGSPEQDRMRSANMAFLNAGDSMTGLRAKEAVLGQMYAGGNHYQLNADRSDFIKGEDGKPIAANKKNTRAFKSGNMSADDYRETFKGAIKAETIATPKDAENPFAQTPAAATQDFQMGVPAGTLAPGTDRVGQLIDTTIGMDMTPAISDEQIRSSFLNTREPLMRD